MTQNMLDFSGAGEWLQWLKRNHNRTRDIHTRVRELYVAGIFAGGAVVKPVTGTSGKGVSVLDHPSPESVCAAVQAVLVSGRSVIVQERLAPRPQLVDGRILDWNYRVFMSRDEHGLTRVIATGVRAGEWGRPVNSATGAVCYCLEEFAAAMGLDEAAEWGDLGASDRSAPRRHLKILHM